MANVVGQINRGWQGTKTTLSHEHMTNFLGSRNSPVLAIKKRLADRHDASCTSVSPEASIRRNASRALRRG